MTAELRNLPHIASMAFNEPLMLEPAYARVFFCALAGQLGISRLADAVSGDSLTAGEAPEALALSVDDDGPRQARSYQVMNGIAVLPVSGTLVSRTRALQPYSGMTGYNGIIARLQQAASDPIVDGILLDMDTPGGMVAGAFDCADIIARVRDIKPVWALANDPTSGLTAMARQFHNVTAEQIAYVAQLQRSGEEAGALQAANEAATKGFDDQTRRLKENMGTLETWADRTARAFKSMWDAVLDIGRPDTAQEMLIKAEAAFKKADDIWNLRKDDYFVNDEARARYWDDREKARLALEAARKKAEQQSQQDKNAQQQSDTEASRLKYTEEAQKAYERLQTPLEKYTARQEELNKALKDGKILQADYNTLMAAAKKDYEATLKKPKQSGVKVSAGDRQEDSVHAALLTLQAELRTLEKHAGANEKISQQRRDLWKAESQFAVLEEAAQRRQLSAQEKSLLAHKDETLEYKRQLAALGDKVTYQERLNALAQQADIRQETLNECTRAEQSASVVLWEIDLTEVGGERYFFCNEQNEKGEPVTWQGRQYQPYPIQGNGFELNGKGTSTRPTLTVSVCRRKTGCRQRCRVRLWRWSTATPVVCPG